MDKEFIVLENIEIEKQKFHYHKNTILIYDVDINKILASTKVPCGKKGFQYFIGYKVNEKVVPLCKTRPKKSGYRKQSDETKYMSLLISKKNITKSGIKSAILLKKGFGSEPVFNEKYLKTKIKSYEIKTNINFYSDKMPKEGSRCICLSVILILFLK